MLLALLLPHLLAWDTASTRATAEGWTVVGQNGTALHMHGGAPAHLSEWFR